MAKRKQNKTGVMVKLVVVGEPKWCAPCVEQHAIIEKKFKPKYGEEIEIEHVVFTEEKARCLRLLDCAEDDVALPTLVAVDEDDDPINVMQGLHTLKQIEEALGWDAKGNLVDSGDDSCEDDDEDVEMLPLEDADDDSDDAEEEEDEKPAPKSAPKRARKPAKKPSAKPAASKAKPAQQLRAKLAGKRRVSTRSARG